MTLPIQQKGPQILAVLWLETFLAATVISLRYWTRSKIGGQVGWDDWLLVLTWLLMFAFSIICTIATQHGLGIHMADIQPITEFSIGMKAFLIGQSTIATAMGTSKAAVAVFLIRILNKTWHYIILWFWIISMMGISILLAVSVFAQVTPVEALWNPAVKGTYHMNLTVIATVTCVWSAAMDFFLALFPWMVLWQLNMRKKEKITICISLSLGVIAGICGVVRITTLNALSNSADYLYACSDSVCWTFSELTLTIVCVTLPALRPLWKRVTGQSSSGYGNYHKQSQSKSGFASRSENGAINLDYMPGAAKKPMDPTYTSQAGKASLHTDADSDRSILGNGKGSNEAIQRVQEVTVTYDDVSDTSINVQHNAYSAHAR
ncbi:hypothetical protein BFW01_g3299 [Lasiodiplodia theobromae]|uniref:Rhodopsin domain-containing protein n=1 Tax=Lasiodiplodia hormozganensis TaxID=869390 RepID=A0AA39YE04_9PEZI|nr:uncharacterized protein LTHEOB_8831 [Lasiodiplodia theobromae]KAF4541029.1 hypothetical protein LTHEOB_8831 [Lasiodiplodia theobromae]KAF9632437.1 hypothetical protein BFW01_g3299 [Lasiodiplodia theobromae]KAK0650604.1 hypothetical protein DIS24_g6646 [Lasiodiplodia hormozganensis]